VCIYSPNKNCEKNIFFTFGKLKQLFQCVWQPCVITDGQDVAMQQATVS
jgi:hypothetical protein